MMCASIYTAPNIGCLLENYAPRRRSHTKYDAKSATGRKRMAAAPVTSIIFRFMKQQIGAARRNLHCSLFVKPLLRRHSIVARGHAAYFVMQPQQ